MRHAPVACRILRRRVEAFRFAGGVHAKARAGSLAIARRASPVGRASIRAALPEKLHEVNMEAFTLGRTL